MLIIFLVYLIVAVTISGVKPGQHLLYYYLTAEATVPSDANVEQSSSSISTSLNEGNNNNNNKTYQVSLFRCFFLSLSLLNVTFGGGGRGSFVCDVYEGKKC